MISPVLERVVDNCNGTYTSHWGYYNRNSTRVWVDVGEFNRFVPLGDVFQPTVFCPGRVRNAFTLMIPASTNYVWALTKKTGTANSGAATNSCVSPGAKGAAIMELDRLNKTIFNAVD